MSEVTRSRLALALCLAAVAAGATVRWPPVFNDFWLDEQGPINIAVVNEFKLSCYNRHVWSRL